MENLRVFTNKEATAGLFFDLKGRPQGYLSVVREDMKKHSDVESYISFNNLSDIRFISDDEIRIYYPVKFRRFFVNLSDFEVLDENSDFLPASWGFNRELVLHHKFMSLVYSAASISFTVSIIHSKVDYIRSELKELI